MNPTIRIQTQCTISNGFDIKNICTRSVDRFGFKFENQYIANSINFVRILIHHQQARWQSLCYYSNMINSSITSSCSILQWWFYESREHSRPFVASWEFPIVTMKSNFMSKLKLYLQFAFAYRLMIDVYGSLQSLDLKWVFGNTIYMDANQKWFSAMLLITEPQPSSEQLKMSDSLSLAYDRIN